jgi:hypothetical protein
VPPRYREPTTSLGDRLAAFTFAEEARKVGAQVE